MDRDIQPSFIPKQVLTENRARRREPAGLFLVLSFVVLISSLIFFGGVFYYRSLLRSDIEQLKVDFETRRQSLAPESLMTKVEYLDKQLKQSLILLNEHRTLLPAFRFLEDKTLRSIRYGSFSQSGSSLTLRGSARNYEGIARQSIVFSEDERITDFVFSDLSADADGLVSFSLKIDLVPSLFSYAEELSAALIQP